LKRKISLLVLTLAIFITFVGCGSSKYEEAMAVGTSDYSYSEAADFDAGFSFSEESNGANLKSTEVDVKNSELTANRKLIKTVSLSLETKDFDNLILSINSNISAIGGYVESVDSSYGSIYSNYKSAKYSTIVARVPVEKLDEFVGYVGSQANVTYKYENVSDVTLSYVDLESHKKMLLEEQKRLLELMEQASTVEDIITIENSLTDVRYQLESMESQLRSYDNQIDYSTVTISVSEVIDYSESYDDEKSAFEKMSEGFVKSLHGVADGLKDFGINFVIKLPYIVVWIIIILLLVAIIKKVLRHKIKWKNKKKSKAELATDKMDSQEEKHKNE